MTYGFIGRDYNDHETPFACKFIVIDAIDEKEAATKALRELGAYQVWQIPLGRSWQRRETIESYEQGTTEVSVPRE